MKKIIYYLLSLVLFIVLYCLISHQVNKEIILPKITSILHYAQKKSIHIVFKHVSITIFKALTAYLIAIIIALLLAILSSYKKVYELINPYISILRTLPTISIIIVLLIWFGKDKSVFIIPILVILPIIFEMFYHSLNNVNPLLIEVCQVYQFPYWKKIRYLYLYSFLEGFILSLKQTFGLCFKIIVMAEVIGGAKVGIGAKILEDNINLEIAGVFFWTTLLIVFVLIIDNLVKVISKSILKWR